MKTKTFILYFFFCFFVFLTPLHSDKSNYLTSTEIQISDSHQFLQSETPSLSFLEGIPNPIIHNHVHAISGSFIDHQVDLELGVLPLRLERTYMSHDNALGSLFHGWNHNNEEVIQSETQTNHRYAISKGKAGGEYLYRGNTDAKSLKIHPKNFKKGVTNCSAGEISGRTNVVNNRLKKTADKNYILKTGAGNELRYKKICGDKHKYQAYRQIAPSKHQFDYSYDTETTHIQTVSVKSPLKEELSSLSFTYPQQIELTYFAKERIKKNPVIIVKASDGRKVKYTLGAFRKNTCDDTADKTRYRIIKANRPNAPNESYEYSKPSCCIPEQVTRKKRPEGRFLEINYYDTKNLFAKGKVKSLKGPYGKNPTPVTLFTFQYIKESDNSASTIVKDGLGHRTIYRYSRKDNRLNQVEKFYGNSFYSTQSLETLEWGPEEKGSNLLSRKIYDSANTMILERRYEYDDRGNVLKSLLKGNILGKETSDTFTRTSTFSNDGLNLPTSIAEGVAHVDLVYVPGTDLLSAKYTKAGQFHVREFYEYDANHTVKLVITDDGQSRDKNDLVGVTQRTIERMTNLNGSLAGLPETIESYFYDLTTQSEVLLKRIVNRYDNLGRLLEEHTYDNQSNYRYSKRWEYNSYGQKIVEVNPLGDSTSFTYDANGNMLSEQRHSDDRTIFYTYDLNNNLTYKEIRLRGDVFCETFKYDIMGNKSASTDVYGVKTRYHYDALRQLSTITYAKTLDEHGTEYERKEFKEYDVLGNVTLTVDGLGNRIKTSYTLRGAPYLIEFPNGAKEAYEYSLEGELISYTASNGTTIRTKFDELSRPIFERTYDSSGELLFTKNKRHTAFNIVEEDNGNGLKTLYTYDGAGRLIQIEKGSQLQTYAYDSLGRQSEVRNHVGVDAVIIRTEYDNMDRVIAESTNNAAGEIQLMKRFEYDADSNCIAVRTSNQAGESVELSEYNGLGQLVKVINPLNEITYYTHELSTLEGRPSYKRTVIDPQGNQKVQQHNELGQVVCELYLNSFGETLKRTKFGYDRAGNQTRRIDDVISPNGVEKTVVTIWTYDCMNRLLRTIEAYGSPQQRIITRSYDLSGNLISLDKADGVRLSYSHDALGRLLSYISSDQTVHYSFEYNLSNHPVKISDHIHNVTTTRKYNINQQLTEEVLENGLALAIDYDSLGRVSQISYPDDSFVTYEYEGTFLKHVQRHKKDGELLYTHTYAAYDKSGNLTHSQMIGNLGSLQFEYDLMNRITRINTPVSDEKRITYDMIGNMVSRVWDDKLLTYAYDDLNQLKSEAGLVKNTFVNDSMFNQIRVNETQRTFNETYELETVYRYDRNGNVIGKDGMIFEFDALNRLTKVLKDDVVTEYRYDSFHRRIAKISDESEWYFYCGNLELGATNSSGTVTQLRVLGKQAHAEVGAAIAIEINNAIYAPLHDSQGNVITLLDMISGEIAETCRYSAYGQEVTDGSENRLSPWRCASKRFDEETGFTNFGRRYYDASELRWISLDPVLISEGTNRYNYLENNPFKYIDPDGRFFYYAAVPIAEWTAGAIASAIVGALASVTVAEVATAAAVGATVYASSQIADKYHWRLPAIDVLHYEFRPCWKTYSERATRGNYLPIYKGVEATAEVDGAQDTYVEAEFKPKPKQPPRFEPKNLEEQLTLAEAAAGAGIEIMEGKIKDPNYPTELWQKKQHKHEYERIQKKPVIDIHYWEHRFTQYRELFKFKNP